MKTIVTTIRLTFAILFLSTLFIACESTSVQDDLGVDEEIQVEEQMTDDEIEEDDKPL
ncbi:hypothetical protein [Aquimarina rhabdastrellae]